MPDTIYKNKVVYGGQTLIDLTDATASADELMSGYTAYGADGSKLSGNIIDGNLLAYGYTTTNMVGAGIVGTMEI